jgi:DNA uptake protein ComE-like DNA-binding protein
MKTNQAHSVMQTRSAKTASVLIIVLWVAFGLVALTLYFAHSMSLELRAADNSVAGMEAEKAIEGAARYVSNILANAQIKGVLPDTNTYVASGAPVGDATFWLIGRGDDQNLPTAVHFGLVDEASKLNINTAGTNLLSMLPRMTPELIASIIDWRDSDDTVTPGGAESDTYMRLNPPYRCKNGRFETVDELRLVNGAFLEVLYGEDANLNGVLDPNENDGDLSPPYDNRDGRLDSGVLDYFTVYSRDLNTSTNGTQRVNVGAANMGQQLAPILQNQLGAARANAILRRIGIGGGGGGGRGGGPPAPAPTFRSVMEFYIRSGLTSDEFAGIEDQLRNPSTNGLVNINTAGLTVLTCIPGIGIEKAATVVAFRRSLPQPIASTGWLKDALDESGVIQAGPFITGRTYQISADIAAVGHFGRGFRRVKFVFDTSSGTPRIIFRQELTHMGWALGSRTLLAQNTAARNFR